MRKNILGKLLTLLSSLVICVTLALGLTSCEGGNPFKEEHVTVYLTPKTILEEHPTVLDAYVLDEKLFGDVCDDKAIYEHLKSCFYFVDEQGQKVETPKDFRVAIWEYSDFFSSNQRTSIFQDCNNVNYNFDGWITYYAELFEPFEVKKGNKIITYKSIEEQERKETLFKFQTIYEGK